MFTKQSFQRALKPWYAFAVGGLVLSGTLYVTQQQQYRQEANDPQIQMAEDIAAALQTGANPAALVPITRVDPSKSLAPFVVIEDTSGTILASNADLHNAVPKPPQGVLDAAHSNSGHGGEPNENRITWQPSAGVRIATVVVYYGGDHPGYVIAGRSIREVEKRVNSLTWMTAVGFMAYLILTFGLVLLAL